MNPAGRFKRVSELLIPFDRQVRVRRGEGEKRRVVAVRGKDGDLEEAARDT